jgi:hypothetical protein
MKQYKDLPLVNTDTVAVGAELKKQLKEASNRGLMDIKITCSPSRKSSSTSKLWVLNNVLRMHTAGMCDSKIIEPMTMPQAV